MIDQPGSGGARFVTSSSGLELWGGHECTVNRVGDAYLDQTIRTGHHDRLEDLAKFAELGFKALRYPVLWERVSPDRPDARDWRWTDERLAEIRRLGMRPIAGLCHHGSGPHYTNLLDPGFATGLAEHARAAALRYPWITDWTPVNEPLTTARFSALYGHWYPHARDETAFFTALLNQVDAVRLSMKAIRSVIPGARLIQTDDLGHTLATSPLQHQADFDNERRWLGWDLLTGRLQPSDLMWARMEGQGFGERLRAMAADPCPPDVIGVNYYLSSERFLDDQADRYPEHHHGSNFGQRFADVETVRVVSPGQLGVERLIESAWRRYGLPIAVTECHNGCTREEQMRWLNETWSAAQRLRTRGAPVEAVTVWSLLGSCDWNRLLTVDAGHYEIGVFDVRTGQPRPTAMAELCRQLGHAPDAHAKPHPVLSSPGWWSRDIRYIYQPVPVAGEPTRRHWSAGGNPAGHADDARPLLITGATGTLGQAFARACEHRGLPFVLTDRRELAVDDADSVRAALARIKPWAVINTAGWVRVDDAEADSKGCMRANADAVGLLARACEEAEDTPFLTFSSDLVFDGLASRPYVETDSPNPLNVYGRSKALAETAALACRSALVIRTSAFFSPQDSHNFAHHLAHTLARNLPFEAGDDCVISPTYVPDLVEHALDLLIDGETGVWHLANDGAVSWAGFAAALAAALGLNARLVRPVPSASLGWTAQRPAHAALASERGRLMPALDWAITRYADAVRPTLKIVPALVPVVGGGRRRSPTSAPSDPPGFVSKPQRVAVVKAVDA